ncbi:MAG: hypothetical protein KY438_01945 [Actinobacteria bacterium]|nr:hypothetical protein [Actinomycetota bacterium]
MPPEQKTTNPRVPPFLTRIRHDRQADRVRPGTEFDSSDPEELVRRLEASDCFCRDTKVGRMYHPNEVSFRELTARDSLHVSFRRGRTVSTHIDRHSPLARRQSGGTCRYSPLHIVAHNVTGALNDLLRLTIGRRASTADYLADQLVDDHAVSDTVTVKEVDRNVGGDHGGGDHAPADHADVGADVDRRDDTGELQAVGTPSRP